MNSNSKIKRAFLDTEDGQILYRICGEGEPIVLLHRSPRSGDEFTALMPILAQNKLVIAMDLMGYGDSDKPPRNYSLEDYAKTIILLLDELKLARTSLLGNHTGGYVAGEFAAAYPERTTKVILSNIDYFTQEELDTLIKYYDDNYLIQVDGSNLLKRWSISSNYANSPELAYRCFLDQLKCYNSPPYGPLAVNKYFSKIKERFSLINCPTLFLSGIEDMKELEKLGLAKAENRDLIVQAILQVKRVDIEGGSFCMMNQMPEIVAQVVVDFLNSSSSV